MTHLLLTLLFAPLLRLLAGKPPAIPRRVLVIQLAKIGDLLCSTPVWREIKRRYPETELSVLATPVNGSLLHYDPQVDHVIEATAAEFSGLRGKLRLISTLRRGGFDTLVCLNAGAAYSSAGLWAGIPRRLGVLSNFGGASHRIAARLWSGVEAHRGDRLIQQTYLALLEQLDVRGGRIDKAVHAAPGAALKVERLLGARRGPLLGIGVSSANRLKALGSAKIIDIARQLLAEDSALTLVLIGSADDAVQAGEIRDALASDRVFDACGALALAEMPALLERLTAYLGVDSGITYMADAVGTAVVSVVGPCNMEETRPTGTRAIIMIRRDLPCQPCAHIFRAPYSCRIGTRACIVDTPAVEISSAVIGLLAKVDANGAAA